MKTFVLATHRLYSKDSTAQPTKCRGWLLSHVHVSLSAAAEPMRSFCSNSARLVSGNRSHISSICLLHLVQSCVCIFFFPFSYWKVRPPVNCPEACCGEGLVNHTSSKKKGETEKYNSSASLCYQISEPNLNDTAQTLASADVTWVPPTGVAKVGKDKFSSASHLILICH